MSARTPQQLPLAQRADHPAVDRDGARGRPVQRVDQPQQRRLPGAGVAHDPEDVRLLDVEVDVVEGEHGCGGAAAPRELPGRAADLDQGHQRSVARTSDSTLASDGFSSSAGVFTHHRGVTGVLDHAVRDGLRVLVDLHELEVRRVVGVLGTRGEDVDVRQGVGVLRVVLRDHVVGVEAGVLREVVVDDGAGDVLERGDRQGRVELGDLDPRLRLVDVREVGERGAAGLQGDQAGRLQHQQPAGAVARVVRAPRRWRRPGCPRPRRTSWSTAAAGRSRWSRSGPGPAWSTRCSRPGRRCAGTG